MESPWSALSGKNKGRHGVGQSVGAAEEVCRTGSWAGIQMREGRGEDLRDKGYTGVSGLEQIRHWSNRLWRGRESSHGGLLAFGLEHLARS